MGALIDERRYPRTARYLGQLPSGLASYPQCQAKGSVLRNVLDTAPIALDLAGLPDRIQELVAAPPLPSDWTSEVALNTLILAYQDLMPREQFARWGYERNRALLSTSLYRVLFLVVSTERLFVGMPQRWAAFRRGTSLHMVAQAEGRAELELRFPSLLHDAVTLELLAVALRAAGDAASAKVGRARTEVLGVTETSGRLLVAW